MVTRLAWIAHRHGKSSGVCHSILINVKSCVLPTSDLPFTPLTLHGQHLALTTNSKYLGVTISSDLSWNAHINTITKKANQTLGFLRRNVSKCPPDIKTKCYESFVRPILEYSSSAWAPTRNVISRV
ncbi:uncharacterized protein [Amphiura filiformis]|uniref:uncharacterized protein n=1 Tax=Amphiura filiformis TaxID=82378 RepID=UPI003B226AF0